MYVYIYIYIYILNIYILNILYAVWLGNDYYHLGRVVWATGMRLLLPAWIARMQTPVPMLKILQPNSVGVSCDDKNKLRCYPQQLERFRVFKKCLCHKKHRNPLEFHKASAPEPSGASQDICPGNPPEPHHASSPRPSGTSSSSCTGNFRNLSRYLHQNPLEPNQVSAP